MSEARCARPAVGGRTFCHPGGMRFSRCSAAAVLATAALVLSGCAGGQQAEDAASTQPVSSQPVSSPATASSATATSGPADADAGSDAAPFPADVEPDTAEPVDASGLTVTAVRTGTHDGFDRVVFELSGEGAPGWDVQYVDAATAQGTGEAIELAGPEQLRVILRGTSYPYETGATEVTRGPVAVSGAEIVTDAFYDGTFEGQSLAYVGTGSRLPFRVYALTGPSRVVVDVATP